MYALSLEQFKAVLAHELGHLSGNHTRFSAWIYRIRKTWMQIYDKFHQTNEDTESGWVSVTSVVFKLFLNWYWPAFNAYSFILARMNEYEADRCSAQLTSAQNAAETLINVEIKGHFINSDFWPTFYKQVEHEPKPPGNAYSSMLTVLKRPIDEEQTNQWLEQALVQETNYADTHPCLTDRLKSLGYLTTKSKVLPQPATAQISAAEYLLGNSLHQFSQQFDQDWQIAEETPWRHRYAYLKETKGKLQALGKKAQVQTLNQQEAWERAYYTLELQGTEAALPFLQDLLKIEPNHARANYLIGELFLSQDNESGIAYIEKAIAQRTDWVIEGCDLVSGFFGRQAKTQEAQEYRKRAEQHYQLLLKAQQERADVSKSDSFKSHTLKESEVNELKQHLASYPQIKEAYLVEKVVKYFPEKRFCILGIVRKRDLIESVNVNQELIDLLAENFEFPTEGQIIVLNHSHYGKVRKKMTQIARSLIFKR